jgi:hypothetical protein
LHLVLIGDFNKTYIMTINIRRWLSILNTYYGTVEYNFLLVLAGLHKQKTITDEKLKGQFKALKAGTLQRFKGTYHCSINDRWYTSEPATELLSDLVTMIHTTTTLSIEEFVSYIMKYNGMNYNYAINVILKEYIKPMFDKWNPEYDTNDFAGYIGLIAMTSNTGWAVPLQLMASQSTSSGCGDYYCYSSCCCCSKTIYDKNEKKIMETLTEYFHSLKKGNLTKIPKYAL